MRGKERAFLYLSFHDIIFINYYAYSQVSTCLKWRRKSVFYNQYWLQYSVINAATRFGGSVAKSAVQDSTAIPRKTAPVPVVVAATVPAKSHPGDTATAADLMDLAREYHRAAIVTLDLGRKGEPLSRAPGRLLCIHAIELYLNVYLVMSGQPAPMIRSLQHDLASRAEKAAEAGLILRRRTIEHFAKLSSSREYVVSRYGPEMTTTLSHVNRLQATLEELAAKVWAAVERMPQG